MIRTVEPSLTQEVKIMFLGALVLLFASSQAGGTPLYDLNAGVKVDKNHAASFDYLAIVEPVEINIKQSRQAGPEMSNSGRLEVNVDTVRILGGDRLEVGPLLRVVTLGGRRAKSPLVLGKRYLLVGIRPRANKLRVPRFHFSPDRVGSSRTSFSEIDVDSQEEVFGVAAIPTVATEVIADADAGRRVQLNLIRCFQDASEEDAVVVARVLQQIVDPDLSGLSQTPRKSTPVVDALQVEAQQASAPLRTRILEIPVKWRVEGSLLPFLNSMRGCPTAFNRSSDRITVTNLTFEGIEHPKSSRWKPEVAEALRSIALTTQSSAVLRFALDNVGRLDSNDARSLAKWLDSNDELAIRSLIRWLNRESGLGKYELDHPERPTNLDKAIEYWKVVLATNSQPD